MMTMTMLSPLCDIVIIVITSVLKSGSVQFFDLKMRQLVPNQS